MTIDHARMKPSQGVESQVFFRPGLRVLDLGLGLGHDTASTTIVQSIITNNNTGETDDNIPNTILNSPSGGVVA